MSDWAYYNEIDPYCVKWLQNLINAGHIAPGIVDSRSIEDVTPDDLRGFRQCHFFAGLGGWSYAARLAGWPDSRQLWTGSAPCQPFSVAGKGDGFADVRDLWPHYFRLIAAGRPDALMGEQVAAAVGKSWLDRVCNDLEGIGYAVGAAVVPACAVNAPHRRDRLWFVARSGVLDNGDYTRLEGLAGHGAESTGRSTSCGSVTAPGSGGIISDAVGCGDLRQGQAAHYVAEETDRSTDRLSGRGDACNSFSPVCNTDESSASAQRTERSGQFGGSGSDSESCASQLADGDGVTSQQGRADVGRCDERGDAITRAGPSSDGGFWHGASWIIGHDGKARRVEPSIRLLAHGVSARVGKLRAYGNAIVPQVAAEIIGAFMDGEK